MSLWAQLPPEFLQVIAEKHTNYVDYYVCTRAVCKSWYAAIQKRPNNNLLCQLPFLLLPNHLNKPDHRGFYSMSNDKTYRLELPEAFEKRCCGSSHGWLIMVEETPTIFLLNPLTRTRIELPSYDYRTYKFVAYKLDTSKSIWLELDSLGNRILFLGWNCFHSISSNYENSKGNCIYFTDDNFMSCSDFP
ncbi:hypothetical protein JCGZ_08156 [Jatropha curcas]|uniref:KIB1-4 beta-propeller domain-containing protein n=1 Tax=Jatropha curcas TaxID=180498 RepID=A0A067KX64_JATCU|nr:hypothetical protein JCGZ_08156 [Jatropha curcas]